MNRVEEFFSWVAFFVKFFGYMALGALALLLFLLFGWLSLFKKKCKDCERND